MKVLLLVLPKSTNNYPAVSFYEKEISNFKLTKHIGVASLETIAVVVLVWILVLVWGDRASLNTSTRLIFGLIIISLINSDVANITIATYTRE